MIRRRAVLILGVLLLLLGPVAQACAQTTIAFLCPLVSIGRPNVFGPRIVLYQQSHGAFPAAWATTDAIRAEPYAIGVAEVNAAQLVAIQADPEIISVELARWLLQFQDQPALWKVVLNSFLDRIGVAKPVASEVIEDIADRVIGTIGPAKNLQSVLAEMEANR